MNPLAAELAKVSLWLEAMEPGRPLAFLDAQIKVGNALIGATPRLLEDGIPNDAFKPIEGDDNKIANALEQRNKRERENPSQRDLFGESAVVAMSNLRLATRMQSVISTSGVSLADVAAQRQRLASYSESPEYRHQKLIADAWCAAFVWSKTTAGPAAITERQFRDLLSDPDALEPEQQDEVARLAAEYKFFHWHLEFPHLFPTEGLTERNPATGWGGGFAAICANPPWDKVDFEDKKYFASVDPEIAGTSGAARKRLIEEWLAENPSAGARYAAARRKVKGTFHFAKKSGVFPEIAKPVKGVNSIQLDHLFAEQMTAISAPHGRVGALIPTTIATGAGAQHLLKSLVDRAAISALFDFDNSDEIFKIHRSWRFCMIAACGYAVRQTSMRLAFGLRDTKQLHGHRIFELTPDEIELLNPNTGTMPTFQSRRDADVTLAIYRRESVCVLVDDHRSDGNPWRITTRNLYNMTDDEPLFRTRAMLEHEGWELARNVFELDGKQMFPLYEGKMVHHYDHRWGTFAQTESEDPREPALAEKSDPSFVSLPRYWVPDSDISTGEVDRRGRPTYRRGLKSRLADINWDRGWLLGWRDICRATDERTAIGGFLPQTAVGHTEPLIFSDMPASSVAVLVAALSSFALDFVCRQKFVGMHLAVMTMKQLPVVTVEVAEAHSHFIAPRVAELACTTSEMTCLAADLGCDIVATWDVTRRAELRAELDAYMFKLYGICRSDLDYIMETFSILKRKDIAAHSEYRTKRMILEIYDAMAEAEATGVPYASPFDELNPS